MNGFSFLLRNIFLDHFIRNGPRADGQVPSGPNMPAPQLLAQMWKLLEQNPRTRPFQPLHYFADGLMGMIRYEDVNMVVWYFTRQNVNIMLHSNLAYQVTHTDGDWPRKHFFAILGYPYQVNLKIVFRVRAYLVPFHTTILHETFLRLKARGFHHPRWGH